MRNAKTLRIELDKVFEGLKDGTIKITEAAELANLAGKMISSAKVQVEYFNLLKKTSARIDFLEED
jgi:hypothetical protein